MTLAPPLPPQPLKLIVAGSRKILSQQVVSTAIEMWMARNNREKRPAWPSEIVHGDCYGVDRKADWWAAQHGIKRYPFPAQWERGKKAGPIRNRHMAEYGDELLAIWDGVSRGTANMIDTMRGLKKPTTVVMVVRSPGGTAPDVYIAPDPPTPAQLATLNRVPRTRSLPHH